MLRLYNLLVCLLVPVAMLYFVWRSRREPAYRKGLQQRLGKLHPRSHRQCVMIHAASLGEVQTAIPLARAILEAHPNLRVHITCFTPAAFDRLENERHPHLSFSYLPLDAAFCVRRFLDRLDPAAVIIIEVEIWPGLLCMLRERGIPVMLASARLSERSLKRMTRPILRGLYQQSLSAVTLACVQDADAASRLRQLNLPETRIHVTGNLKFDIQTDPQLPQQGRDLRAAYQAESRPVWIAASTHEDEEQLILNAHSQVLNNFPDALLILVPRHPQRFETIAGLCRNTGLQMIRRSQADQAEKPVPLLLADTLGELMAFYAAADIAFIGGSLVEIGGHNLLEAAALGVPMIVGPHTRTWADPTQAMIDAGAAKRVNDAASLARDVKCWFDSAKARRAAGEAGLRVLQQNRGALAKTLNLMEPHLVSAGH